MKVGLIWAQSENNVIGSENSLPWYLPEDLAHFKAQTLGCPIIAGRNTWESFPKKYRPLPGRTNIVLSRRGVNSFEEEYFSGAIVVSNIAAALSEARSVFEVSQADSGENIVWVVGGGEIFVEFLDLAFCAWVTQIKLQVEGSVLAPILGSSWQIVPECSSAWLRSVSGLEYRFLYYEKFLS